MLFWRNELLLVAGKLCAVLLSVWVTSHVDGKSLAEVPSSQAPHNNERVRACGVRLKYEIASICNLSSLRNSNGYYSGLRSIIEPKKSFIPSGDSRRSQPLDANGESSPTRASRGVIEECCRKPCDRLQLLKYCARTENRESNASTTTETAVSESTTHSLRKRTSLRRVKSKGRNRGDLSSSKTSVVMNNCLHCGRQRDRTSERSAGCLRARRRNSRRRKSQADESQTLLLPLLVQLLWDLDNMNKDSNYVKNYIPQKLPEGLRHRQRQGSGRGIRARDIYKQQFAFLQPGMTAPASDETPRDQIGSSQSRSSEETHPAPLVKNLASQVTDEPQPEFFPIPAGTNAEFFIL